MEKRKRKKRRRLRRAMMTSGDGFGSSVGIVHYGWECDGEPNKASLSQTHSENSSSGKMLDGWRGRKKKRRDGGREERGENVRGQREGKKKKKKKKQ